MVKVRDLLALATFSGSPPERTSLIPEIIISTTAITAANINPALTTFLMKYGMQLSVPITCVAQVVSAVKPELLADEVAAETSGIRIKDRGWTKELL